MAELRTPEERAAFLKRFMALRQRCRTDLLFLAKEILNYKDIDDKFHGEVMSKLQQFKGGTDVFSDSGIFQSYTPACSIYELEGSRRNLYIDFRGSFKTTVLTICHTIQWVLNYPDIRILVCHSINGIAEDILCEIKGHFQYNNDFRYLFPEHCPSPKKAGEFGNMQEFNTLARKVILKDPTVRASSVESTQAGSHMEVIKCSDIVNKENVGTPDAIRKIKRAVSQLHYLLDRPHLAWIDIEGTLYDFSDTHSSIITEEEKRRKEAKNRNQEYKPVWSIHQRGIRDEDGKPVWPGRFPEEAIEAIRNDPTMTTSEFCTQYLSKIVSGESQYFNEDQFIWVPMNLARGACTRFHMTVDLCSVDPIRGPTRTEDFTVICVCGFDQMNRMYVLDISRGRYLPSETIDEIFRLWEKYKCLDVKIEDAAGARQIIPMLDRQKVLRKKFPLISLLKVDNRTKKLDRILGLQPWFKARDIRFVEDIPHKEQMLIEFVYLTKYNHDDIPDAIADQMQNRYTGPMKTEEEIRQEQHPWYLAPDPLSEEFEMETAASSVDPMTGL